MAPLASAFVEGRIDTSRFGSDIRTGMATASTRSSIDSAGKSTGSRFSSAFGNALKIGAVLGAAFAVTKGAQFLKGTIEEAREAQKVGALTGAVLKSTGQAANVTRGEIEALALSLSLKAGIDDEVIQKGENLLLTFRDVANEAGRGNDIFTQGTQAALDLSAAMGKDLNSSVLMVGKALNSPVLGMTALSRAGVQFTDQQKEQITTLVESGKTLDAQKIILSELSAEFEGAAASQATAGEKASVAWGNFKEEVGKELLPVLDDLETWFVKEGIPVLERFADWFGKDGVPALEDFAEWVTAVGEDALPIFSDALKTGRNVISDVAPLVADLVGWFKDLPAPIRNTAVAAGLLSATGIAGGVARLATSVGTFATNARNAETRALALKGAARSVAGPAGLGLMAVSLGEDNDALGAFELAAGGALLGFSVGGPIGAAIGAGIGGLGGLAKAIFGVGDEADDAKPDVLDFSGSLDQLTGAATRSTRAVAAAGLEAKGLLSDAAAVGIRGSTLVDAIVGSEADWERVTDEIGSRVEGLQAKIERLNTAFAEHPGRVSPTEHVEQVAAIQSEILALEDLGSELDDQRGGLEADAAAQRRTTAAILGTTITAKELRKAFEGIPPQVQTQIRELGTDITRRDVVDLGKQYELLPGEVDTLLKVLGKDKADRDVDSHQKNLDDTPGGIFTEFSVDIFSALKDTDKHHKNLDDVPTDHGTKFTADTDDAKRKVDAYVQAVSKSLSGIDNEDVTIKLATQAQSIIDSITGLFGKSATGGPIRGRGTHTSDSIPTLLSNDEHVVDYAAVVGAGDGNADRGHKVWAALRMLARNGRLGAHGDLGIPGFAAGGPVLDTQVVSTGVTSAIGTVSRDAVRGAAALGRALSATITDYLTTLPPTGGSIGGLGSGGSLAPAQIVRGQDFARSQSGKPYQYGGIGNPSWDCSGFVGGVLLAAKGLNPYQRIGSTASMPWAGFTPGTGSFTVGNDPGSHMAGAIGGLGIESNGYYGVKAGALNTPLGTFADLWKYDGGGMLPSGDSGVNLSRHPEAVLDPDQSVAFRDGMTALVDLNRKGKGGGGGGGDDGKDLKDKLEDLKNALAKNTDQLHSTMQAQQAFSSSVTAQFRDNELTGGGLSGFSLGIEAGTNDARKFLHLIKDLQHKGLDGPLLRFIMESGDLQLAQEFDQLNRKQIHRKENLYGEYLQTTHHVGQFAGQQQFGHEIKKLHHTINHLANQIHNLHDHIADGAAKGSERGVAKGMQDRGKHLHTRTAGRAG